MQTERRKIEEALRKSEERYQGLLHNLEAGVVVHAPDTSIIMNNSRASELLGLSNEQMKGKVAIDPAWSFIDGENNNLPIEEFPVNRILTTKKTIQNQVLGIRRPATNDTIWVNVNGFPIFGNTGEFSEIVISFIDITNRKLAEIALKKHQDDLEILVVERTTELREEVIERKESEEELEKTRATFAEAQKIAHVGSFEYIASTQSTRWSEEEYRIFGLDPAGPSPEYEDMLARCIHPEDASLLHEVFVKAMQSCSIYELEHRIVRPDGSVRWVYNRAQPYFDEMGELLRYVGITQDITDRKESEAEITRLAMSDQLTGLANRTQFHQRFDESLKLARREDKRLALMLLDLDEFKPVNDTYGHLVGDAVLQTVASIFTRVSRETDVVARLGGDEFAILIIHPDKPNSAGLSAQRIIDEIKQPMNIMGNKIQIGTSIGIAFYPDDADIEMEIHHKADQALYEAKKKGRGTFCFYNSKLTVNKKNGS